MVARMVRYLMVMCLGLLVVAKLGLAAGKGPDKNATDNNNGMSGEVNANQAIQDWPSTAKSAAMAMIQKYGQPNGVTPDHLMWMDKGNFHEIDVFKEEVEHNFPTRHMDVVKHTVFLRVPADKVDELAEFDGSIEVNRTRGTVSAFCDSEEHNILALNLASDIVNSSKSVQEARQTFASLAGAPGATGAMGSTTMDHGYIQALRFNPTNSSAVRDPGQSFSGTAGRTGTTGTGMGTGLGTGTGSGTGTGTGTGMGTGTGNRGGIGDTTRVTDTLRNDTGTMNRSGRSGINRTGSSTNRTGAGMGRNNTGRTGTSTGRGTGATTDTLNRRGGIFRDTADTTNDSLYNDTTGLRSSGTGTSPR